MLYRIHRPSFNIDEFTEKSSGHAIGYISYCSPTLSKQIIFNDLKRLGFIPESSVIEPIRNLSLAKRNTYNGKYFYILVNAATGKLLFELWPIESLVKQITLKNPFTMPLSFTTTGITVSSHYDNFVWEPTTRNNR